jgi:T5SS/PEP-CTERM-associated repeat protein
MMQRICTRMVFGVFSLGLVLVFASTSDAQVWNTGIGISGNWSDPTKWVGDDVPDPGFNTILGFSGTVNSDFTATNDLSPDFHLFAMIFNIADGSRFLTIDGDSLYFEGPVGFNGQSAIQQDGSGSVVIANDSRIGGVGMTVQGAGGGTVQISGSLEGSGLAKINASNSILNLSGGTSGSGLGYLVSRSGLTQLSTLQTFEMGYLGVNDAGNVSSEMEIIDQAQVFNSGQLAVGKSSTSTGTLSVLGAGTLLTQSGEAFIGDGGYGTLFVNDDAVGNFADTVWVGTQNGSTGEINAQFGSTLSFTDSVHLGVAEGSSGGFRIEDATVVAATDSAASFSVGVAGQGYLGIVNGGSLSVGDSANISPLENELVAGRDATGVGTVYVETGSLTATNAAFGFSGDGRLMARDNSNVSITDTLFLGYNNGSYGEVVVRDFATLAANDLQIGREGIGSFSTLNNGHVSVAGSTFIAPLSSGDGLLFIAGTGATFETGKLLVGGVNTGGNLVSGGEARVEVLSGGSLVIDSELVLYDQGIIQVNSTGIASIGLAGGVSGAVNINAGGKLAGTGLVQGNVVVSEQGILTPGLNDVGTLQIDGDLTFLATTSSAIFAWDLASAGLASNIVGGSSTTALHDRLIINGGAVTMNNLAIVLSEIGDFAASFDASQSYSWKLMEIDGSGDFTAIGPFSILFNGSSEIQSAINANQGTVSLLIGNSGGSNQFLALSYSAVPEPSSLLLVMSAALCTLCRRSRTNARQPLEQA